MTITLLFWSVNALGPERCVPAGFSAVGVLGVLVPDARRVSRLGAAVPCFFIAVVIDLPAPPDEVHLADANQHGKTQGPGNPVRQDPPGLCVLPPELGNFRVFRRPRHRPTRRLSAILGRGRPGHHRRRQSRTQHRRAHEPHHGDSLDSVPRLPRQPTSLHGMGQTPKGLAGRSDVPKLQTDVRATGDGVAIEFALVVYEVVAQAVKHHAVGDPAIA
jgi:hypothetical protein